MVDFIYETKLKSLCCTNNYRRTKMDEMNTVPTNDTPADDAQDNTAAPVEGADEAEETTSETQGEEVAAPEAPAEETAGEELDAASDDEE